MKKGQRRPVEILRLVIGETVTDEHIGAIALSMKLRQTVTAKLGEHASNPANEDFVESCIVLEARPT